MLLQNYNEISIVKPKNYIKKYTHILKNAQVKVVGKSGGDPSRYLCSHAPM